MPLGHVIHYPALRGDLDDPKQVEGMKIDCSKSNNYEHLHHLMHLHNITQIDRRLVAHDLISHVHNTCHIISHHSIKY